MPREWSRRALAPKRRPMRPEGGPSPPRNQPGPRAWADRRDDDRHRLDDRVGHLHHLSGIIAIERRAGMALARVGSRWLAYDHRRAVLLRVGDHDAARRRRLCFSARSIRSSHRIFVWLDVVSRDSNRDHRCGGDCVCEISWRFCPHQFRRIITWSRRSRSAVTRSVCPRNNSSRSL